MPVPVIVPVAAVGGLLYLLLAGGGSGGARKPWKQPIKVPGNDVPWNEGDEAICSCYEAGEHDSVALVNCALSRMYPMIEWPAEPEDHETVMRTWQAVGHRVAEFLKDPAKHCEQVPPPPPPGGDIATPAEIAALIRTAPESFLPITKTHNANPSSAARAVYGLAANSANVVRAVRCVNGVGFNLLFCSRVRPAGDGYATAINGKKYDIGPAWLPWNNRLLTAATTGTKLRRQIGWQGKTKVAGGDGAYFSPWYPPVDMAGGVLVPIATDPWDPRINPPARVLAALGWSLDEMRTAWQAGNP